MITWKNNFLSAFLIFWVVLFPNISLKVPICTQAPLLRSEFCLTGNSFWWIYIYIYLYIYISISIYIYISNALQINTDSKNITYRNENVLKKCIGEQIFLFCFGCILSLRNKIFIIIPKLSAHQAICIFLGEFFTIT